MNNLVTAGQGREAAFAAAVLGDNALMEKAWQDTGMLAEAVLHAHVIHRKHLMPFETTCLLLFVTSCFLSE